MTQDTSRLTNGLSRILWQTKKRQITHCIYIGIAALVLVCYYTASKSHIIYSSRYHIVLPLVWCSLMAYPVVFVAVLYPALIRFLESDTAVQEAVLAVGRRRVMSAFCKYFGLVLMIVSLSWHILVLLVVLIFASPNYIVFMTLRQLCVLPIISFGFTGWIFLTRSRVPKFHSVVSITSMILCFFIPASFFALMNYSEAIKQQVLPNLFWDTGWVITFGSFCLLSFAVSEISEKFL